jgi:hypothetical protein
VSTALSHHKRLHYTGEPHRWTNHWIRPREPHTNRLILSSTSLSSNSVSHSSAAGVEASVAFGGEATLDGDGAPRRGGPRWHGDIYPLLSRTTTLSLSLSLSRLQTGVVAALDRLVTLDGEEQRGGAQRAPDEVVTHA